MDEASLQLWRWIRDDRSIALCRLESVRVEVEGSDEHVHLVLATLPVLWGPPAPASRAVSFTQPASEHARARSGTPVWEGVPLQRGQQLLYVAEGVTAGARALFAGPVVKDDPTLAAVREVTAREEVLREKPLERRAQYLAWLREGRLVQRLFAGQALAKDPLPGVDLDGEVARAMAALLANEKADLFLRLSLLEWANDPLWKKTTAAGKAEIVRADATALGAGDANLRRFARDALVDLDPLRLAQDGVVDARAAALLRERAAGLPEGDRARLERLAEAITPRR